MKKNEDSSVTLYVQKDSPGKSRKSNWLPAPNDSIYLVMSTGPRRHRHRFFRPAKARGNRQQCCKRNSSQLLKSWQSPDKR